MNLSRLAPSFGPNLFGVLSLLLLALAWTVIRLLTDSWDLLILAPVMFIITAACWFTYHKRQVRQRSFPLAYAVWLAIAALSGYKGLRIQRITTDFVAQAEARVNRAAEEALSLPDQLGVATTATLDSFVTCLKEQNLLEPTGAVVEECVRQGNKLRIPFRRGGLDLLPTGVGVLDAQNTLVAWTGNILSDPSNLRLSAQAGFVSVEPELGVVYQATSEPFRIGKLSYRVVIEQLISSQSGSATEFSSSLERALEAWYPGIHVAGRTLQRPEFYGPLDRSGTPSAAETEAVIPLTGEGLFYVVRINVLSLPEYLTRNISTLDLLMDVLAVAGWLVLGWNVLKSVDSLISKTPSLMRQYCYLGAALGIIGSLRLSLVLIRVLPTWVQQPPMILDPAYFGTTSVFLPHGLGFFASSLTLLLMSGALVSWLVRGSLLNQAPRSGTAGERPKLLILVLLGVLIGWYLLEFPILDSLISNSIEAWWWPRLEVTAPAALTMQIGTIQLGLITALLIIGLSFITLANTCWGIHAALGGGLIVIPSLCRYAATGEAPWRSPLISVGEGAAAVLCYVIGRRLLLSRKARNPSLPTVVLGIAALTGLLIYPSLHHRAWLKLLENTEQQVRRSVGDRSWLTDVVMEESLDRASMLSENLARAGYDEVSAWELWSQTDLAAFRIPSSLTVWAEGGVLLSRFVLGLPTYLSAELERGLAIAGENRQFELPLTFREQNVNLLVAGKAIAPSTRFITISLPIYPRILLQSSAFSPLLSPFQNEYLEGVIVTEYREFKPFNSYGGAPLPFSPFGERIDDSWWTHHYLPGKGRFSSFYIAQPDSGQGSYLSIAIPRPTAMRHVKGLIEFYILASAVGYGYWYAIRLFQRRNRGPHETGSPLVPFRIRFILAFVIASVIPLGILSFSFETLTKRSITGLLESGSVELSKNILSLLSDYESAPSNNGAEPGQSESQQLPLAEEQFGSSDELPLGDSEASRESSRQLDYRVEPERFSEITGFKVPDYFLVEIQKYFGGETSLYLDGRIVATTRPDLYTLGLLPIRVPGAIWDELKRGSKVAWRVSKLESAWVKTLYVALPSSAIRPRAILAVVQPQVLDPSGLPLPGREGLFIILAAGSIMLLIVLSYWLSSMISYPIEKLVQGTRRIVNGVKGQVVEEKLPGEFSYLSHAMNLMATQISEQQEALEKRRLFIETLIGNISVGVLAWNPQGWTLYVNGSGLKILGLVSEPSNPQRLNALIGSVGRGALLELIHEFQESENASKEDQLGMVIAEKVVTLKMFLTKLSGQDENTTIYLLLFEDLSELIRSSKLQAWTDMARRVAHEIKNPLTPIQLSIEHLRQLKEENSDQFEARFLRLTDLILEQVEGLRAIASEFSRYAKLPAPKPAEVALEPLIRETLELMNPSIPPAITIDLAFEQDLPTAWIDRDLVQRALLNIVQNAVEAMVDKGKLSIVTSKVTHRNLAAIMVTDTGPGIPEEQLIRLFEPYFSTRKEGSGLGLAIAKKSITDHGGDITVSSIVGQGTTFTILLPLR